MNQALTAREIPSTVTSKGQVTIPFDVRRHLGVDKNDKIIFVVEPGGAVLVKPLRSILTLRGAAGKLPQPLLWNEIERTVQEDRADVYRKKHG